jgi:AraC-like DNA-binding protein
VAIESEDEKLLKNIVVYLEENLTNPKLSVEELSSHLAMSRNSLYTKLLELTGETPRSTHSFTKAGKSSRFIGEEQDDRSSNGFLRWIFYAELFRQII